MRGVLSLAPLGVLLALSPSVPAEEVAPAIADGSTVRLEYTLKDDAGAVVDTTEGREPFTYVHGTRQILNGLERGLLGLRAGDEKEITLPPEDAYGPVNPAAVAEISKERVPSEAQSPGRELVARTPDGRVQMVRVKEVREETVVLDLNHPLAGKTLHFEVRILEVVPAENQ